MSKKSSRTAMREVLGYVGLMCGEWASMGDPDFEGMASHDAELSVTPARRIALYALATELTERSWKMASKASAAKRSTEVLEEPARSKEKAQ